MQSIFLFCFVSIVVKQQTDSFGGTSFEDLVNNIVGLID